MTLTTTSRPTRVRVRIFVLMWILILVNFVDRSALSISLPFVSKEFTISPELEGWILGSFFWTYLLFQLPGGWLLDRFGPRRVIGYAGIVWGVFQMLGGIATGGLLLVFSRLGLGAAEAPTSPGAAKLNSNWLPSRERARGATFVDMAGAFGAAIGGVVVTGLIGMTGSWRWAFLITGALTILLSIANFLALRDTPQQHPKVNAAELQLITSDSDPADLPGADAPRLLDYARSRSWWALWIGRLGWATVWWGIIAWTPSYLAGALHFDLAGLGWGMFLVYGAGVVGELLAGWITDKLRARFGSSNGVIKSVLAVSGVGQVVAILTLPAVTTGYAALAVLATAVFFNQMGGIYWAFPAWLAPKRQVGTVGGVMNIASSLGGGIAPVIMGYAIAASSGGFAGAFMFLAIAAAVYLAGSMTIDFARPLAVSRRARAASRDEEATRVA
jgi:Sugar phosphate permease